MPSLFCVQGNMDFHRRNYDSLLDAAVELKKEKIQCVFKIVGRLNRSAVFLQRKINKLGLSEYFLFESDTESYSDYYRAIHSCRFLLFLVDDSRMIYHPFSEDKCTSSLGIALGLDVIRIINRKLAKVYDITECSVLYESSDVYSGIRSALSNDKSEVDLLASRLRSKKQKFSDDSEAEFRRAVGSVIKSAKGRQ